MALDIAENVMNFSTLCPHELGTAGCNSKEIYAKWNKKQKLNNYNNKNFNYINSENIL